MTQQHHHHQRATREQSRVALVTCAPLRDLDPDDRLLVGPLSARGARADAVSWDDPHADWAAYDLAVLRSTWDYPSRRDEFLAWAARVPALANPAEVVAWNTDKRYLAELAAAGVPVASTAWVEPGDRWRPPPTGEYVVKPAVGAGGVDSGRYDLADPDHRSRAAAHVARLQAAGRPLMVQPYLAAVDAYGETALVFVAGAFSHAIRKGGLLTGPDEGVAGLYRPEEITARVPSAAEHEVAARALAALPPAWNLLYARVDLVPGPDGSPVLLELELTEPSLFLGTAVGAPDRFAAAIAARTSGQRPAGQAATQGHFNL